MLKWIRKNWGKSLLLLVVGYAAHLAIETFVVTNVLALFGAKIPVLV